MISFLKLLALGVSPVGKVEITDCNSIAELRAINTGNNGYGVPSVEDGSIVNVDGYYSQNDGGGGMFIFSAYSSAADDGGITIAPTVGLGRWIRQTDGKSISVKCFGAKNDNSADATTFIQKAIDFMSVNGGVVYFPAGTYQVNSGAAYSYAIGMKSNVSLVGAGKDTTIISIPTKVEPPAIFGVAAADVANAFNVTVSGLSFDGGVSDFTGLPLGGGYEYSAGLKFVHGENITVRDCSFYNFKGDGIIFGDSVSWNAAATTLANVRVIDCDFDTIFREAVFVVNCDGCMIRGCTFGGAPYVAAIEIERHDAADIIRNVKISDCEFDFTVYKNAVYSIVSFAGYVADDGKSKNVQVTNCRIHNGGLINRSFSSLIYRGIIIETDNVDVTTNAFISTNAIYCDPADGTVTRDIFGDVLISDVIVNHQSTFNGSGIGGPALRANKTRNLNVRGLTVVQAKSYGVFIAECSRFKLCDSEIRDVGTAATPRPGITIQYTCSGAMISNNVFTDTRAGGARGSSYAIETVGYNAGRPPLFVGNIISNCISGDIYNDPAYAQFPVVIANATDGSKTTPGNGYDFAGSTGAYYIGPLGAGASVTTTIAVTGAGLGDFAQAAINANLNGVRLEAWVSAADVVSVRFTNPTGAPIDLGTPAVYAYVRNK